MKKTTFYGLAVVGGVGTLFLGFVIWLAFFDVSCDSPKSMRVEQDFNAIGNAIKSYEINASRPPTTAQGLDVLVDEPTTAPKPRRWRQMMRKLPMDPWGTPYRYTLLTPKEREWRWELRSAGEDGVFGSGDDQSSEEESGGSVSSGTGEKEEPRPSF